MKNNLVFTLFLVISISISAQDASSGVNDKKVVSIVDRFNQITGPDGNCNDTLTSLQRQLENLQVQNSALNANNNKLIDSVGNVKEYLFRSEKNLLIEKYGKNDTRADYTREQYNDFKKNYFLKEYLPDDKSVMVFFALNKSKVDFGMYVELISLADYAKSKKEAMILIDAYTDSKGQEERNSELAMERATAIRDYLVNVLKVNAASIKIEGKGSNSEDRIPEKELDFLNRRAIVSVQF